MYPRLKDKWRFQSFVSANLFVQFLSKSKKSSELFPTKAILCYHRAIPSKIFDQYPKKSYGSYESVIANNQEIVIRGGFGIGSPAAVVEMEELIARGVTEFISIGVAGSLTSELDVGEYVICNEAFRDEGTSYHYANESERALPSEKLTKKLESAVSMLGLCALSGSSWTTDAPYRETFEEIQYFRSIGAITVEMEASALFILAHAKQVSCGAVFTISDLLVGDKWEPKFDHKKINLSELAAIAITALTIKE